MKTKKRLLQRHSQAYAFHREADGGPGQKFVMQMLKDANIECRPVSSYYTGMQAVQVFGGKRIQARASRIIFGRD